MNTFKKTNAYLHEQDIIKKDIKKHKSILYGAQALNTHMGLRARPTKDWDIFNSKPQKTVRRVERKLDNISGGNNYFTKQSDFHKDTFKLYGNGLDGVPKTKDDRGIMDVTRTPKGTKFNMFGGMRVVPLSSTAKDKRKSLADKQFVFRHPKDKEDLTRINLYNKMKKDKLMRNFLIK